MEARPKAKVENIAASLKHQVTSVALQHCVTVALITGKT